MPDWSGLRDDDVHGSLVRRPGRLPVRSVESEAVSTRSVAFSSRVHTWEEMPDESVRVAWSDAPLVAEGVHRVTDTAVRVDGVLHQRMQGWRAYEDRAVVAHALRALAGRSDGRLEPVGAWFHHSELVLVPSIAPERRDGVVPAGIDDEPGSGAGTARHRPLVPARRRDHEKAAATFVHLPAAVRQGVVDAVPEPDVWLGEIVQRRHGDRPVSQTVSMLRTDADRAVALRAWRHVPRRPRLAPRSASDVLVATDWTVCQLTYELAGPHHTQVTA
jgi:hypothetical protein